MTSEQESSGAESSPQAERFEAVALERRSYRYRARVELAVNLLFGVNDLLGPGVLE